MQQKPDLFTVIHKTIRLMLYSMAKELQTADFGEEPAMRKAMNSLSHTLEMLEEHGRHEDIFIFPPVERVAPGSTAEADQQHHEYAARVAQLREQIALVEHTVNEEKRESLGEALNTNYTDFLTFYLQHMACEERALLSLSKELLSYEELMAIRLSIQMDTEPERYTEWLTWMLPAQNIHELVMLFTQVKAGAPAIIFDKFVSIGKQTIDGTRWQQLQSRLNNPVLAQE